MRQWLCGFILCLPITVWGAPAEGIPQVIYDSIKEGVYRYSQLCEIFPEMEEKDRISLHLKTVGQELRSRNVPGISNEENSARIRNLDRLAEYERIGIYPKNTEYLSLRQPHFIDQQGVACAVGYLVITDGFGSEAHKIAKVQNNAIIEDIKSPAFEKWISSSGLSKTECAMIQPEYQGPVPADTNLMVGLIGGYTFGSKSGFSFGIDVRGYSGSNPLRGRTWYPGWRMTIAYAPTAKIGRLSLGFNPTRVSFDQPWSGFSLGPDLLLNGSKLNVGGGFGLLATGLAISDVAGFHYHHSFTKGKDLNDLGLFTILAQYEDGLYVR